MINSLTRRGILGAGSAFLAAGTFTGTIKGARAAENGPIRIALLIPMSGPGQVVGVELKVGGEVARDRLNRAGGIAGRKVELVVVDDRGDPNQDVSGIRQLSADGINMVVGVPFLAGMMAVIPLLQDAKVIVLNNGASDERISHELFNRNAFVACPNNIIRQAALAAALVQRYPNVTTWVGAVQDTAQGVASWARFGQSIKRAFAGKKEITLLDPVLAKVGTTDFKQQIAALINTPAKGLFTSEVGADGITFFQQARSFGMFKKFTVVGENAIEMDLPKALKKTMPDNVWSISYWSFKAYANDPESQELAKYYSSVTGDPYPHGLAALSHDSVMAYAAAIEKAGSTDTGKVIGALEGLHFKGVRGPATFRKEDHQLLAATNIVHFVSADNPAGWTVKDVITVNDADNVNPPTPGVKLDY